jgi:hypothetical protein
MKLILSDSKLIKMRKEGIFKDFFTTLKNLQKEVGNEKIFLSQGRSSKNYK